MKKLLLLSAMGALGALTASAQSAIGTSVMRSDKSATKAQAVALKSGVVATPTTTIPNGKTTTGGSRWYSYTDYCNMLDGTFINNDVEPYLWNKGNGMAIYGDGSGGVVADTIQFASYGMTFDPAFSTTSGFNEPTVYPKNSIIVTRTNAYTVDSIAVSGIYGRNNTRTAPVDTLRIAVVYGNGTGTDLPIYYFTGMASSFGKDTVRFAAIKHDTVKNIASGTTRVIKDLLLRNTDTNSSGNAYKVGFPGGLNIPAGNVVGITVTFITGDTYVPYVDTIFYGSVRSANPFGRGLFRPIIFEQNSGAFPNYYDKYYNTGFVKFLPESASWSGFYVPSYAYTAPFQYEIPAIDVKVSCATCKTIQETSVKETSIVENVAAYPNPTNTVLNVPFTIAENANVTVSISNMVGQVVATQNMGAMNAGQKATATFNTSALAAGVYLYTVEANGQRVTNRFSVAH